MAQKKVRPTRARKLVPRNYNLATESGYVEEATTRKSVTEKVASISDIPDILKKRKFFIKANVISAELFYVPCWEVELKFHVSYFKARKKDRGSLTFVVDPFRGCGVIEDNIKLNMRKEIIEEASLIEEKISKEQAEKKAIIDARWKVLMARYKRAPELETAKVQKFYRPYYKAEVTYGDKQSTEWAPADSYANYFVYN